MHFNTTQSARLLLQGNTGLHCDCEINTAANGCCGWIGHQVDCDITHTRGCLQRDRGSDGAQQRRRGALCKLTRGAASNTGAHHACQVAELLTKFTRPVPRDTSCCVRHLSAQLTAQVQVAASHPGHVHTLLIPPVKLAVHDCTVPSMKKDEGHCGSTSPAVPPSPTHRLAGASDPV